MMKCRNRESVVSSVMVTMAALALGCGGSVANNGPTGTDPSNSIKTTESAPGNSTASAVSTGGSPVSNSGTAPSAPSPFHLVANVDYELDLQRLGKNAVIVGGGQLLPIRDNTVTFDPKFAISQEVRGDGVTGAFMGLLGAFPEPLYASVVRPSGRTGFTELYKWSGSKWVSDYSTNETTFVLGIQPWQNGTSLMAESHSFSGELRFTVLPRGAKVFAPDPHDTKWKGASSLCETGFVPDLMRTLISGHVFMTGVRCSSGDTGQDGIIGVKRWSASNSKGTVDVLPDIGEKGFEVVNIGLRSDKDAYVGGNVKPLRYGQPASLSPYLAHFDGTAWKTSTLPFSDALASLEYDAQGKLWVISVKGAVYSRIEGGSWTEVALPRGPEGSAIEATTIWLRGPGDEWIVGKAGSRYVVLHSGPPGPMAQLPDLETMDDAVNELAMPTPFTWRCSTPFVLLYTLSKVAPPDFDYPATREALKGHSEFEGAQFVEFKRLDKRFMGAFVPDANMGKKLVELVKKKVPNTTPQLACHAPKPSRVIEIDLSR